MCFEKEPWKEPPISETRINERIRVPEVRLVGPGGEQVGVVRVEDALRLAEEAGLDLVEVAPDAKPQHKFHIFPRLSHLLCILLYAIS